MHFTKHQVLIENKTKQNNQTTNQTKNPWWFKSRQRMIKKAETWSEEWCWATPIVRCGLLGGTWAKTTKSLQNNIKTECVTVAETCKPADCCSALAGASSTCIQGGCTCWGREVSQARKWWPVLLSPASSELGWCDKSFACPQSAVLFALCATSRFLASLILAVTLLYSTLLHSVPFHSMLATSVATHLQDFWLELEPSSSRAIPCAISSNVFWFTIRSIILAAFDVLVISSVYWK